MDQTFKPYSLIQFITIISGFILFICSSARHALFQSTAFDLGWFDQAIYLISQGSTPLVSFSGFHILGDHASIIFYPIALFYWLHADVHWLFAIQAIALASGTLLTWHLAQQAGLDQKLSSASAISYILYPLVFNVNLFDFHPEVIAIPAILGAVLAARSNQIIPFTLCILLTLSCKAVLSLTVIMLGIWLVLFEQKRWCGGLASALGLAWFIVSTQLIFPYFTGNEHAAVGRYTYLGNSVLEIALNLFKRPDLVFSYALSLGSLEYLLLLLSPILWGLSIKNLAPLIPIIPQLILNLLSEVSAQRDLIHQYSVPILPFLLLTVITSLVSGKAWLNTRKAIVIWSTIAFVALAKPGYFWTRYLGYLDSIQATQEAITYIETKGGVLTTANIAPHLTHRQLIQQTLLNMPFENLEKFDYILLNSKNPGWGSNSEFADSLIAVLQQSPTFKQTYQRDNVYLFVKQ